MTRKEKQNEDSDLKGQAAIGGIIKGLTGLVGKLGDLAEAGERLKRSGEFEVNLPEGKEAKGVYGFSVKVGLDQTGEREFKVEPFGNVRRDEETGKAEIQELHEPLVDLFDEEDHLLVVAEMPGVGEHDLALELEGDILILSAERGEKKYRKEILLPEKFAQDKMTASVRNGVVEIKFDR